MLFDLGIKKKSSLKTDMKPKKIPLEKETHLQTADVRALWVILGAASKHKTIHTKPFSTRFFQAHPAHLCCPISCICSICSIIFIYNYPKNHWTLQWRGERTCVAGCMGPQNSRTHFKGQAKLILFTEVMAILIQTMRKGNPSTVHRGKLT